MKLVVFILAATLMTGCSCQSTYQDDVMCPDGSKCIVVSCYTTHVACWKAMEKACPTGYNIVGTSSAGDNMIKCNK